MSSVHYFFQAFRVVPAMNQNLLCSLREHLLIFFGIVGIVRTHQREGFHSLAFVSGPGILDDITHLFSRMNRYPRILQVLGCKGDGTVDFIVIGCLRNRPPDGQALTPDLSIL